MGLFLSSVTNKVDAKGRVSVPAKFRAVLKDMGQESFVCFPSFTEMAIEALTMDKAQEISERLDEEFNPFAEDGDAFATSILADSHELPIDKDGRIMLPEDLMAHTGITVMATFVGLGRRFQIWEPEAYREYRLAARDLARANRRKFAAKRAKGEGGDGGPQSRSPRGRGEVRYD